MSDENTNRKKDLEELAREAGVYLSPDRLSAIEQRLKDEERRRAMNDSVEPRYDQQPNDRGTARPVGRPRGVDRRALSARSGLSSSPSPRRKSQKQELYMTGPRVRRFV